MEQPSLFNQQEGLFETLCSEHQLYEAFRLVKKNKGAPGVDGITIETFEKNLKEEISSLSNELRDWKYHPKAVKRVEIPKPGGD